MMCVIYSHNTQLLGIIPLLPLQYLLQLGARDKFSGTYGSTTSKLSDTQPTGWFSREYTAPSPQHIKNGR
jgi:hypothetical protein